MLARDHPSLRRTLLREVERGSLSSPLPGAYVARGAAQDPVTLAAVVCAVHPRAVVCGWTAAALTWWPSRAVLPVSAAGIRLGRTPPWLQTRRSAVPHELVVARGPLRITCPALTAVDLAVESTGESVFAALRSGSVSVTDLAAALRATPGRPGNAERGRLLERARRNPWSGGELRFQQFLASEQLQGFEGNVRVRVFGRTYRVDLALLRWKVGIEFDSVRFHADRRAFEADRRKHNDLEAAGWRILHVTWQMLVDEPAEVLRRIRQLVTIASGG